MPFLKIFYFVIISFLCVVISTPVNAEELQFRVHGKKRNLILEYPKNSPNAPVPLVLVFHGGGGNSSWMQGRTSKLKGMLLEAGYAVAFMNGAGRSLLFGINTWNAKYCCGYAAKRKIDDIAYIDIAIYNIVKSYAIDENNIFFVGHSNGGMISYRSIVKTSYPVRGVAAISSAMFSDQAAPNRSFSMLMLHTKDDEILPYNGGMSTNKMALRSQTRPYMSFEDSVGLWKKYLDCDGKERKRRLAKGVLRRSIKCAANNFIRVFELETGGHKWNKSLKGISLPKIIFEFIQDVRKSSKDSKL